MNDKILTYLKVLNRISNISVEYAILEPCNSAAGDIKYNLHIVFTPKIPLLLQSYVSGMSLDVINETVISGTEAHSFLVGHYLEDKAYDTTELDGTLLSNINTVVISNIARFCNFKFASSTDPFLSMFLEEKNIMLKTKDFDDFFFSKKEEYKPSKYHVVKCVLEAIHEIQVKSKDYHYYSSSAQMSILYQNLYNTMRLYFIALQYLKTDELLSTLEDNYEIILSTFKQASKPWDYVQDCAKTLSYILSQQPITNSIEPKEALKKQALNFLHYKICEESSPTI